MTLALRRGRPSAADLTHRLMQALAHRDDMRLEVNAAGQEMVNAGRRVEYAIRARRDDLALHTAASLVVRGERYRGVR